jgi:hypothetical protein
MPLTRAVGKNACGPQDARKLDLILHLTIRRPHFLVQLGVLALSKTSATATADELGRERFVGPLKPPCVEIVRQDHVDCRDTASPRAGLCDSGFFEFKQ